MKSKIIILYGVIISLSLGVASVSSAATILTDNFNSYNDGSFHGQGGWVSNPAYIIGFISPKEGAKALRSFNFNTPAAAYKSGALLNDGQITAYVRRFDANQPGIFSFILREGNVPKIEVRGNFGANRKFQYVDGSVGSYINFGPVFGHEDWYAIQIQWRSSDHFARYNIDGGSWTDWTPSIAPWVSGLDTVRLEGANAIAWDAIQENLIDAKTPVLIVPGLMGTEMKDGDELLWANIPKMFIDPSDNFLDSLAFNSDITPSSSSLRLAEVIRKKPLSDYTDGLINEFVAGGYIENQNLFTFPYDWRYGVSGKYSDKKTNSDLLGEKIQEILAQTGSDKVDVIAHSQGGLVVKKYVMDHPANHSIGKAVFVGVPNTGAVKAVKVLLLGDSFDISFAGFGLSEAEIKKISENLPAAYDLLPSQQYYDSKGSFIKVVQRDGFTATQEDLTYQDFESYIADDHNLNAMALAGAKSLHDANFDNFDMRTAGVDVYAINGCNIGTLDKITESRQSTPLGNVTTGYQMITFNDGDETVPIESSANLPVDQSHVFYSLKVRHSNLLSANGTRQQIVNLVSGSNLGVGGNIITQDSSRCGLNGKVIYKHSPIDILAVDENGNHSGIADDGAMVNEIPGAGVEIFGEEAYLYLPTDEGQVYDVNIQGTGAGTYTIGSQNIVDGEVTSAEIFSNLPVTEDLTGMVNLGGGQTTLTVQENSESAPQTILPSAVLVGDAVEDVVPPVSVATLSGIMGQEGFYRSDVSVEINATDENSGVLALHYKIDGGAWQSAAAAAAALTFTTAGEHIITFFATDNAGNNKQQQTLNFTIDKTAPEAVIEFDPVGKDLKFSAQNDPGAVVVDNDNVITLADQAGNVTQITLKNKNRKITRTARIDLLTYNGALADIGSNMMVHAWMADKNGELSTLVQQIIFKDDFHIQTIFNGKTTMVVGKDSSGRIYETFSGLKMIKISTNKGGFGWSY